MEIRRFDGIKDIGILKNLLKARNMDVNMASDQYGVDGYVVYLNITPVAAGFLRKMEGDYGMLDAFITDPVILPEYRDKALDVLMSRLIDLARSQEITKLLAFTTDENTLKRVQKHGFGIVPHTCTVMDLKNRDIVTK